MAHLKVIFVCYCLLIFVSDINIANASQEYSPALTGFLGLNNIPNARMDKAGDIRFGIAVANPYIHGYIGLQIAEPLHINIRQSSRASSISKAAERISSGIDIKLRLLKESAYRPEISLGIKSIIGGENMAGEYIALSKSYKALDLTTGIGWGRSESLKQNKPSKWFSGENIGFFGGVEYFTPYDGLSIKLDYNSDKYISKPWGLGLSYTHNKWLNASIGAQGTDKIFAQISLKANPSKWVFTHKKYEDTKPFYKLRGEYIDIPAITQSTDMKLSNITDNEHIIYADLELAPKSPAPQQIGRAARHISMNSGQDIEEIHITPQFKNLHGTSIKIMRSDIERNINNDSSPQEIWKNTEFISANKNPSSFFPAKGINNVHSFTISLENQISLSENDTGTLYRSSALIEGKSSPFKGFMTGLGLRINIANNLERLANLRAKSINPIRNDIYDFAQKSISIDNAYTGYAHSFTPTIHAYVMAGYIEEFYNGIGGEILYRPFTSRFAIGAEIWNLSRRDPYTPLNLGLKDDKTTTGFISAWYDLKEKNLTLNTKIGRFLAGDTGISLGLNKLFKNGAKISATTTLSNSEEGIAYHNISLSLPLGSIPYIPEGSEIITKIEPFGRDAGQSLNKPINLFDMTEAFTLDHMANNWLEIME